MQALVQKASIAFEKIPQQELEDIHLEGRQKYLTYLAVDVEQNAESIELSGLLENK